VILEIIEITRGEAMKNGISVSTQLADRLPVVEADRVQLQQVVLNLIVNALDAMVAAEGPRELLISTGTVEAGGVLVAVQDSGPGLKAAMLERVFESFYTTKPNGLGMGLVRSSRRMADAFGRARTGGTAPPFSLHFLAMQTFHRDRERRRPVSIRYLSIATSRRSGLSEIMSRIVRRLSRPACES
jgi:C4-dicarboxylate-specific signal transduction histidine kinase